MSVGDEGVRLAMHREADERGKFSVQLRLSSSEPTSREAAAALVNELLPVIARNCLEHGADMVGHVKALLSTGNGNLSTSLIDLDEGPNITHGLGKDLRLEAAELTVPVIVRGLWGPQVRERSMRALQNVLGRHGLGHEVIKVFYDTEKGFAHHQK